MKEVNNVLRILKETRVAFKAQDALKIKHLSNQTINTASRTQDADNISVAVIVYSLGKILEGENYRQFSGYERLSKVILSSLDHAIADINKKDYDDFRKDLENIRREVGKLSGKLRKYIRDVFERAKINKASRIYEHGISMERTARLLGITMFELANYSGSTGISEAPSGRTISAKERVKMAANLFK